MVSRTTARFIADGHPWVRPDRFTRGLDALRPGQPATLVDERGRRLASALADPGADICARVYHRRPDMAFAPAEAIARAWARRAALHADPATDCYRIVHGEADFLPGLRVERLGPALVAVATAGAALPWLDEAVAGLRAAAPGLAIVVKEHIDDLRRAPVASRVAWAPAGASLAAVAGRELGLRYRLAPAGGLATGIYVDQRATRAWLGGRVAGARVLNLFSYTGAFSLAALAAGAAEATDVDLSAPALEIAAGNAADNGLADRHRIHHGDAAGFLRAAAAAWDVIIVDPPTSAQGGPGWILRRDYPELLRLAASRLVPGGLLVAACNAIHGKPFPLAESVAAAGCRLEDGPGLGPDVPQLAGFPEGRPFRLAIGRRAAD